MGICIWETECYELKTFNTFTQLSHPPGGATCVDHCPLPRPADTADIEQADFISTRNYMPGESIT